MAGSSDLGAPARLRTVWTVEPGGMENPSAVSVSMYRALGFRPADDLMRLDL